MEIEGQLFEFRPLMSEDWDSLEQLFGKRGAVGGCWCMFWKQTPAEFNKAGWCAVEPRESYSRLGRVKVLAPVDDQPVWSITCFYIGKQYRRKGLMRGLLNAAIDWAISNGAHIIESYPFDTQQGVRSSTAYRGVIPFYLENGFIEVMKRSPRRPIMRKYL